MTKEERNHFIGWCILEKKITAEQIEKMSKSMLGKMRLFRLMNQFYKEQKRPIC